MKEHRLYTCEICNTDHKDLDKAIECERNHKLLKDAEITGKYKSLKSIHSGVPIEIKVYFKDIEKYFIYKLDTCFNC